jgi:hypothetical protein
MGSVRKWWFRISGVVLGVGVPVLCWGHTEVIAVGGGMLAAGMLWMFAEAVKG